MSQNDTASAPQGDGSSAENLAQRLQRLEDAIASLQDTRVIEDRVVERVTQRLQPKGAPAPQAVTSAAEDKRHSLKRITQLVTGKSDPPRTTTGPAANPTPPANAPFAVTPETIQRAWFVVDVWMELRIIIRMFFDVRYHIGWWSRVTVLVLLPLILLSDWWVPFSSVLIIGPIFEKLVDLVLAFFVYKVLTREAARYRQTKFTRTVVV